MDTKVQAQVHEEGKHLAAVQSVAMRPEQEIARLSRCKVFGRNVEEGDLAPKPRAQSPHSVRDGQPRNCCSLAGTARVIPHKATICVNAIGRRTRWEEGELVLQLLDAAALARKAEEDGGEAALLACG